MHKFRIFLGIILILLLAETSTATDRILSDIDVQNIKTGTVVNKNTSVLVVALHGLDQNGSALASVQKTLADMPEFKGAHILLPNLPFNSFSMASPSQITAELLQAIDNAWGKYSYERIVLVGYSMGALYARKI